MHTNTRSIDAAGRELEDLVAVVVGKRRHVVPKFFFFFAGLFLKVWTERPMEPRKWRWTRSFVVVVVVQSESPGSEEKRRVGVVGNGMVGVQRAATPWHRADDFWLWLGPAGWAVARYQTGAGADCQRQDAACGGCGRQLRPSRFHGTTISRLQLRHPFLSFRWRLSSSIRLRR